MKNKKSSCKGEKKSNILCIFWKHSSSIGGNGKVPGACEWDAAPLKTTGLLSLVSKETEPMFESALRKLLTLNCWPSEINVQLPKIILSGCTRVTQLALGPHALPKGYLLCYMVRPDVISDCPGKQTGPSVYSVVPKTYSSVLPVSQRSHTRCINLPWAMT